jgi:hypothetical protein
MIRRILPESKSFASASVSSPGRGTLCAPTHALYFGLSFRGALAWIAAGFPYDVIHMVGNFAIGVLAPILIRLMLRLEKR